MVTMELYVETATFLLMVFAKLGLRDKTDCGVSTYFWNTPVDEFWLLFPHY